MRASGGNEHCIMPIGGELDRAPLPICRQRPAQIDDHIEGAAGDAPHQLGLVMRNVNGICVA
ncbi:hypothetical protein ABIF81_004588 [Bradyrhizobium daqingense]